MPSMPCRATSAATHGSLQKRTAWSYRKNGKSSEKLNGTLNGSIWKLIYVLIYLHSLAFGVSGAALGYIDSILGMASHTLQATCKTSETTCTSQPARSPADAWRQRCLGFGRRA